MGGYQRNKIRDCDYDYVRLIGCLAYIADDQGELSINADKLLNCSTTDLVEAIESRKGSVKDCEEKLQQFHDWYDKQPHLPAERPRNAWLVRFLVHLDFGVEKLKESIDNYYNAKNEIPEIFQNRDPLSPNLESIFQAGCWVILPKKTEDNCRITVFRLNQPHDGTVADAIKCCFMMSNFRLLNDTTFNEHWIIDLKYHSFQRSLQISPMFMKKMCFNLTHCIPVKLKGMHFINMPSYVETSLNLFKKLMKKKIADRIRTYSSFDEIFTIFPKSMFPCDFGGDDLPSSAITDAWKETLQSSIWRSWFLEQDKNLTDESKRVGPSRMYDHFGVDGTFQKLEID